MTINGKNTLTNRQIEDLLIVELDGRLELGSSVIDSGLEDAGVDITCPPNVYCTNSIADCSSLNITACQNTICC